MSQSDAPASTTVDSGPSHREEILEALATARSELVRKIESGRVRDAEYEKVRIKRARALAYVANVELDALESEYLEELREDVDELKNGGESP